MMESTDPTAAELANYRDQTERLHDAGLHGVIYMPYTANGEAWLHRDVCCDEGWNLTSDLIHDVMEAHVAYSAPLN